MANNLKAKLIRENPAIARLQDPKYRSVNFLRGVNQFTNFRYPSDKQIEAITRIMDEFDASEKIQPLADMTRRSFTGQVINIHRKPRNKAYDILLVIKCPHDPNTYVSRRPKSLAKVKQGDTVTLSADLKETAIPSSYWLRKPTKAELVKAA